MRINVTSLRLALGPPESRRPHVSQLYPYVCGPSARPASAATLVTAIPPGRVTGPQRRDAVVVTSLWSSAGLLLVQRHGGRGDQGRAVEPVDAYRDGAGA